MNAAQGHIDRDVTAARGRVLDLFAGIGGFSLAAHSVGFDTVAFCEIEPYPQSVLRRHFPGVPIFDDVKELTADALADACKSGLQGHRGEHGLQAGCGEVGAARDGGDGGTLILTAGFPCQDISYAGKGAGLDGARSGLFYEVARLISELRPDYVLLENVAALLTRGIDAVLGTLASLGYDAVWACIPACAVCAPHRRDRVWILAVPQADDNEAKLRRMYEHVLSRLTPFDLEAGWPTATASDAWGSDLDRNGMVGKHNLGLGTAARINGTWPTPRACECRDAPNRKGGRGMSTAMIETVQAGGSLNPDWVDLLQGYPVGYTLPEGEPMRAMAGEWPVGHAEDEMWPTPRAGCPGSRKPGTGGRVIAEEVRKAQHWPAGLGAPQHPWEPPRLTTEKQHRAARLKALGNSIVPAVARLWFAAIQEEATA